MAAITAIVLAAGLSRRASPHNKLLLPAPDRSGRTVVRATVEAVRDADLPEIIVITGHQRSLIEQALAGLPVRFVFAPDFASGMGHSLAAGISAATQDATGFAVTPGDLPHLTGNLVRRITSAFSSNGGQRHVIPTAKGARGHPVVIGAWLRPELENLTGDLGARQLLSAPAEFARCDFVEVNDPAIVRDVDHG